MFSVLVGAHSLFFGPKWRRRIKSTQIGQFLTLLQYLSWNEVFLVPPIVTGLDLKSVSNFGMNYVDGQNVFYCWPRNMNFLGLGKKQAKKSQTLIFSFKFSRKKCPDADVNIQAVKCSPVSKATLIRLAQNIIQVRSDVIVKWDLMGDCSKNEIRQYVLYSIFK